MCSAFGAAQSSPPESTLRSIASLQEVSLSRDQRVVVRGVVTLFTDASLYVQDQTGGLEVSPGNTPQLALGDEVEITGKSRGGEEGPSLVDASITRLWSGSQPVPLAPKPEQAAEGAYDARLIEVEGRPLEPQFDTKGVRLVLENEHQIFAAYLPLSPGSQAEIKRIGTGSVLRLTGVCTSNKKQHFSPVGFSVLLRSFEDVRLVASPPWWNLQHFLLIALFALVLAFVAHRVHIHNLNQRFRAVVEERSRLAREMHDTLAQGFSGVALQLENLAAELRHSSQTPHTKRHLDLALRMVRHSREDAHSSIFVLRSLATDRPDILQALVDAARLKSAANDLQIITERKGVPFDLSDETAHNLLRLGQEAVANVIRHAEASEMTITLHYEPDSVTLTVADNGRGFHLSEAKSVSTGHFGLTGLRERAARIDAFLDIQSDLNRGTAVRVTVPRERKHSESAIVQRLARFAAHLGQDA